MIIRPLFLALVFTTLSSCLGKFSLEKKPYTGGQLRIDGAYYTYGIDSTIFMEYIFYQDGSILNITAIYDKGEVEIPKKYLEKLNDSSAIYYAENGIFESGIFQIDGDIIRIEKRYPGNGFHTCYVK